VRQLVEHHGAAGAALERARQVADRARKRALAVSEQLVLVQGVDQRAAGHVDQGAVGPRQPMEVLGQMSLADAGGAREHEHVRGVAVARVQLDLAHARHEVVRDADQRRRLFVVFSSWHRIGHAGTGTAPGAVRFQSKGKMIIPVEAAARKRVRSSLPASYERVRGYENHDGIESSGDSVTRPGALPHKRGTKPCDGS
jgi:hypothetical protein